APLAILLDNGIYIHALLMDTAHAATNTQRVLDFGDEYATLNQIITAKTGAAVATGEVIESLKGKMDGFALRVPTTDGSFADLYFVVSYDGKLDAKSVNYILENNYSNPKYFGRLGIFNGAEASSADIVGRKENGVIITSKTKVIPLPLRDDDGRNTYLVGILSAYDNELAPPRDQALLTKYISQK
ncbi:MAG: hypothetical protein AABY14_04685, partial [Nanoarchaeota archaeon]